MANPIADVSVTLSGSTYAISPQTGSTGPSGLVMIQNQTGAEFYAYWVGTGAFLGQAAAQQNAMGNNVPKLGPTFDFRIANYYPFTWVAVGASSGSMNYATYLANLSIQSFLTTPDTTKPVAALRLEGSFVITLTPQQDRMPPPHNVHPKIETTGSWDATNPYLSILNPEGENVDLFVRSFDSAGNTTDAGPISFSTAWNAYQVNLTGYTKIWYGFANHGVYSSPADYFTAHPYDPSGGHHTQQIPQGN